MYQKSESVSQSAADKIKWEIFFSQSPSITRRPILFCEKTREIIAGKFGKPICMPGWPTLPLSPYSHSIGQTFDYANGRSSAAAAADAADDNDGGGGGSSRAPLLLQQQQQQFHRLSSLSIFFLVVTVFFSFLFLSSFLFLPFSSVFILHFFVIAVFCHHQDHLPSPQCETWQLPTVSRAYYHFSFLSLFSLLLHT